MCREGLLAAVAALLPVVVAAAGIVSVVGREELIHREGDVLEELAGIITAAAAVGAGGAALVRQAVVVHRHQQLAVPLQADDGELAQRHKDTTVVVTGRQVAAEALADTGRDLAEIAVAAAAVAAFHQLGAEDDGVDSFHNGDGHVALFDHLLVQRIQPDTGGEYLGSALAAEEDDPLVKDTQALHVYGAGAGTECADGHTVEKPHIHRIEAAVEGNGLHIDVGVEKLSFAALDRLSAVEDLLPGLGGVEAQILDAVLITTWSGLEEMLKRPEEKPLRPLLFGLSVRFHYGSSALPVSRQFSADSVQKYMYTIDATQKLRNFIAKY